MAKRCSEFDYCSQQFITEGKRVSFSLAVPVGYRFAETWMDKAGWLHTHSREVASDDSRHSVTKRVTTDT